MDKINTKEGCKPVSRLGVNDREHRPRITMTPDKMATYSAEHDPNTIVMVT